MLLAFLFDQILFAFNVEMKKAFDKKSKTYRYLWEKLRALFDGCIVSSLEALCQSTKTCPIRSFPYSTLESNFYNNTLISMI